MLSQRIHGAFMAQQFLWLTYPVGASSAQKRAQSRAGFLFPNEQEVYNLGVCLDCWQLDWQISSAAQISNALSQLSAVEHLTFEHEVHSWSVIGGYTRRSTAPSGANFSGRLAA